MVVGRAAAGKLTYHELARFGGDLFTALDQLAAKGVRHRDLKPENFGVFQRADRSWQLMLFDFSLAGIQSLARDQNPFARRTVPWKRVLAPGVSRTARTVELGDGFTNAFTLTVDLDRARCRAASSPTGFHLRDLVHGDAVAAVSGSSYISDDPAYQPTEPCLDLACRDGQITSLPTATKPALLIHQGRPLVRTLTATGTLAIAGRSHTWTGSKNPPRTRSRPTSPDTSLSTAPPTAASATATTPAPDSSATSTPPQTPPPTPPTPSTAPSPQPPTD